MDLNLAVICGRLAAPAEHRTFESGGSLLRLLVTVRSDTPRRRVDVLPVVWWDPPDGLPDEDLEPGRRLWVTGSVQRRFREDPDGRRSRLEIVAAHAKLAEPGDTGRSGRRDILCGPG